MLNEPRFVDACLRDKCFVYRAVAVGIRDFLLGLIVLVAVYHSVIKTNTVPAEL